MCSVKLTETLRLPHPDKIYEVDYNVKINGEEYL